MTRTGQTDSMEKIALPEAEMTVDQVTQQWPSTIRCFLDFNMQCVGTKENPREHCASSSPIVRLQLR